MKRLFAILLCFVGLLSVGVSAETVTQKQASAVASMFFNQAHKQVMAPPALVYYPRQLTTDRLFIPFYVYNNPSGGFVVIPAENKAYPILAYSLTEKFDAKHIPESTLNLLKLYAQHIEYVRYDSNLPDDVANAWNDLPSFINRIFESEYVADDVRTDAEVINRDVELFLDGSINFREENSDLFTPVQWQENIINDINKGAQPILMIGDRWYVVHGYKDNFFRLFGGNQDKSFWRLMPTETINIGESILYTTITVDSEPVYEEELPFVFSDSYFPSIVKAAEAPASVSISQEPFLAHLGSGYYELTYPSGIKSSDIFAPDGTHIQSKKHSASTQAIIDISSFPKGLYIALITFDDGRTISYKLIR